MVEPRSYRPFRILSMELRQHLLPDAYSLEAADWYAMGHSVRAARLVAYPYVHLFLRFYGSN